MLQQAAQAIEERVTKWHVVYWIDNSSSTLGKYDRLIKQDKLSVVNPAPLAGLIVITHLTIPRVFLSVPISYLAGYRSNGVLSPAGCSF